MTVGRIRRTHPPRAAAERGLSGERGLWLSPVPGQQLVVPNDLQQRSGPAAKHVQVAAMRIATQTLLAHRDPHPRIREDQRIALSAAAASEGDAEAKILSRPPSGISRTAATMGSHACAAARPPAPRARAPGRRSAALHVATGRSGCGQRHGPARRRKFSRPTGTPLPGSARAVHHFSDGDAPVRPVSLPRHGRSGRPYVRL